MFLPSTKPASANPRWNAARTETVSAAERPLRKPTRGSAGCARVASGQAAVAPSPATTSRRLTRSPRRRGAAGTRDYQTERLGRLQVDDKLELGRLLNRHFGGALPFEDTVDEGGRSAVEVEDIDAVRHQSPVRCVVAIGEDGRQTVTDRALHDRRAVIGVESVRRNENGATRRPAEDGGRMPARNVLYMAALSACRYNPAL